eukprot:TRINITY_DN12278_c0_g1_i1.p1 TRINITY_DN12278_c0_g1~~TRINITY_DN12278_c0_g1_i1.p1  ORF type:complete len:230 (+),score=20.64 TRINITY_DN12278_c0_g1_i1:29-691(+)
MADKKEKYDYLFKIVIVGDSGCGKSSLLLRFTDDNYSNMYISTIGVDFKFRTLKMDGKTVKLQIWDTAGQERFRNITSSFYRGAHGVILVYDITNPESFANIETWLSDIDRHYYSPSTTNVGKPSIILVGNKSDLEADQRKVSLDAAQKLANRNKLLAIEASAKQASNVETAFVNLVTEILERVGAGGMRISSEESSRSTVKITDPSSMPTPNENEGCGC